jgi:hypothetical protein
MNTKQETRGAFDRETKCYILANDAVKNRSYICINKECKEDLILCKGDIIRPYFRHKNKNIDTHINDDLNTEDRDTTTHINDDLNTEDRDTTTHINDDPNTKDRDTTTHRHAEELLKSILEKKISLTIERKCNRCNAIVLYGPDTLTFDDSLPKEPIVKIEYEFEYNNSRKKADIAQFDKNEAIHVIYEIYNTHKTDENSRPETWFEIDAKVLIETVSSLNIDSLTLQCIRKADCDCKEKELQIESNRPKPGKIYVKQQGAGSGKTYEAIQLLQNNSEFKDKQLFIYLTKSHSATAVINKEQTDQYDNKQLSEVTRSKKGVVNKKYKTEYTKDENGVISIIGTVDSFTYATIDEKVRNNIKSFDVFKDIINEIKDGKIKSEINYANSSLSMDEKCLIIIDEAQDLGTHYLEAFNKIREEFPGIDIYVIGDKLQSIWYNKNIFTEIEEYKAKYPATIVTYEPVNIVRRFHNNESKDQVNKIVKFKDYNLPQIGGICDIQECKEWMCECRNKIDNILKTECKECKDRTEKSLEWCNILDSPDIYDGDMHRDEIDKFIETIISKMDLEVKRHNYKPKDFMFIFPVMRSNNFAHKLHSKITNFWISKYPASDRIDYAVLHSSANGVINLSESENSTRMLTIHSSKGDGRPVVFLLGMTEKKLLRFTEGLPDLRYESLIHVALTRHKHSIYIGLENDNDDICKRFERPYKTDNLKRLNNMTYRNDIRAISERYVISDSNTLVSVSKELTKLIRPDDTSLLPTDGKSKPSVILDDIHHCLRNAIFKYHIKKNIWEGGVLNEDIKKIMHIMINT